MKVIYAGYAKTGTKTMSAVFNEFGYNTYDFFEHGYYHGKEWRKIIYEGSTVEDFRSMYKDADAIVDTPIYIFWEEILEAYPDAKIIFSTRSDESWLKSCKNQVHSLATEPLYVLMQLFSYSGWGHHRFSQACGYVIFGSTINWPWNEYKFNPTVWRRFFRNHNSYLLQNAPKDRMLMFNFKDGWGPICEFLGEKVPDKPFPHANAGASLLKDYLHTHPLLKKMVREAMFNLSVLTLIGAYGGYKVYKNPECVGNWINAAVGKIKFW
ncbi:uncharacterized protein LOC100180176 [Ciona intestinalis]